MKNVTQSKPKEHGQSMVELALTITFLMVLLAGTIDLGRAFFTWLALRDAAQEGASYGSIHPLTTDENELKARVYDNLKQVVRNPSGSVGIIISIINNRCMGNTIQVDVKYNSFPLAMPFLGTILGSQTIPIHATVNDTILTPACH
jgi:Flp pilus assembly protein TadG